MGTPWLALRVAAESHFHPSLGLLFVLACCRHCRDPEEEEHDRTAAVRACGCVVQDRPFVSWRWRQSSIESRRELWPQKAGEEICSGRVQILLDTFWSPRKASTASLDPGLRLKS